MNAPFKPPRWSDATDYDPLGPAIGICRATAVALVLWGLALWVLW